MAMTTPAHLSPALGRLEHLRSQGDEAGARRQAWAWIGGLDARRDQPDLEALFRAGTPPDGPDGDCEGQVLGLFGTRFLDVVDRLERLGRRLGGIGWTGKSFDAATGTGHNRLTTSARLPMLLVMPRYGFARRGDELLGFRFRHRLEPSPLTPDVEVRAVTYDDPEHANPLMLPRTRDELTELLPGLWLGRALLAEGSRWRVVAYFALRQPVGG